MVARQIPQLQEELRTGRAPAAYCRTQAAGIPPSPYPPREKEVPGAHRPPLRKGRGKRTPRGRGVCPARLGGLDKGAGELGLKELIGAAGCSRRES